MSEASPAGGDRDCTAVLVGAGSGARLGWGESKAFTEIAGIPLLVLVVRAVRAAARVSDIVVVVGEEDRRRAVKLLASAGFPPVPVVAGGATRQESVAAGVEAVRTRRGLVAVHDVARPLVPVELFDRTIEALVKPWAAVAPGLPVADTLKLVDDQRERVIRTVDRRHLWVVQTPQVFEWSTLRQAHTRLDHTTTDDLGRVEHGGGRVRIIRGDPRNFKITYPEDLVIAEALTRKGG